MEKNDIDLLLVTLLSTEIYRDGGASLVRDLKDYNSQINVLLKKRRSCSVNDSRSGSGSGSGSTTRGGKLLRFIELYPRIFEVDRHHLPHTVYLLSTEYCDANMNANANVNVNEKSLSSNSNVETNRDLSCHNNNDNNNNNNNDYRRMQQMIQERKNRDKTKSMKMLKERIVCVLKKEQSKNNRRKSTSASTSTCASTCTCTNTSKSTSYCESFRGGVSLSWLLKQCKSQLHSYLRLTGFYQRVYVYSPSHHSAATSANASTSSAITDTDRSMGTSTRDVKLVGSPEWVDLVKDEFISILKEEETDYHDYEYRDNDDRVYLNKEKGCDKSIVDINNIRAIASKVVEKVEEDGGTQISLSLLLHRNADLRNVLSGCDLIEMKLDHEDSFKDIHIFQRNNEVYLQSKVIKQGRMEVDETGLFSVASSKWGKAFASLMANHCKSSLSSEAKETVAIDLTASVGGVTLPLAKLFQKTIAVEIDENRAALCLKNMTKFGVAEKVQIRNEDSVRTIPTIAKQISGPKVIIIDPPWGGAFYQLDKEKEIMMGEWSMVQVMKKISDYLSPTVAGLRMPVGFNFAVFCDSLKDSNVAFDILEVKKAGPQLFIILAV